MKVLLDENFPLPLLDALLGAGIDAEHIITLRLRGMPDSGIRARLDSETLLLLTQDTEFLAPPQPKAGWVMLSRVKQSQRVQERVGIWLRAVQGIIATPPDSRVLELIDDGRVLPWSEVPTAESR